jgi:hypothetical protein
MPTQRNAVANTLPFTHLHPLPAPPPRHKETVGAVHMGQQSSPVAWHDMVNTVLGTHKLLLFTVTI